MFHAGEQPPPQVVKVLTIRFPDLPQEQAFQSRHSLRIVAPKLTEQPMRFAAASRPAVANSRRPAGHVTKSRRRARRQLPRLQDHPGANKVRHLFGGTTRLTPRLQVTLQPRHGSVAQASPHAGSASILLAFASTSTTGP